MNTIEIQLWTTVFTFMSLACCMDFIRSDDVEDPEPHALVRQ